MLDGQSCEEAFRASIHYWMDANTFRFLRSVLRSEQAPYYLGRQESWLGQTVFSDYRTSFVIEAPEIHTTPVAEQPKCAAMTAE